MKKRGVSPVIATVLLIGLVMVLAVIIFFWARGWLTEKIEKFGQPIEKACENVDFDADLIEENLQIINRGNTPISGFDVKQFYADKSEVKNYKIPIDVGGSGEVNVLRDLYAEKVELFPVILGNRGSNKANYYTCLEQGKFVD